MGVSERCFALLSGGKDSVCTAHYLASQGRLSGCIFLDTGIAAPDTLPFVRSLCEQQEWGLAVFRTPIRYEDLVARYGFPKGPHGHIRAFGALKDRGLRLAAKAHPGATFASGVRAGESARRFRFTERRSRYSSGTTLEAAIMDWSTRKVWDYLRANDLSVSPSSLALGISGDCLCGAFSSRGECEAIKRTYPEVARRIEELEGRSTHSWPYNRWGNLTERGFTALRGRTTLDQYVCGDDCGRRAEVRKI